MGGIGVTGGKAANVIGRDADLVIGVGTRFTDFTTSSKWLFNENRKVLGINICPFDAYKMDAEAIVADAKEAVKALISACEGYKTEYTNEIENAKKSGMLLLMNIIQQNFPEDLTRLLHSA